MGRKGPDPATIAHPTLSAEAMNDHRDNLPEARQRLEAIVERALDQARRAGASQAEAGVSTDVGLSVTVRLGEVESLEYQRDRSMGITVYVDGRKGSASTADLSAPAVRETVAKAVSIARFTAADSYAGLADAGLMARQVPDLDLHHPWSVDAAAAIDIARAVEAEALAFDARIRNSEGGSVSTHSGLRVYGNTHGFVGGYASTAHSLSCAVMGQDGDEMQRDYWYSTARDAARLEPPGDVGRRAAERAVARLGSRKLSTRRAPVVFSAEQARGLVGHFVTAVRGGAQYRKSSFLCGAMGRQVFPAWLGMTERPHLRAELGSAPFDNEGVATCESALVRAGVLERYVLDAYSARKLGLVTTGNAGGVHNLEVEGGDGDLDGLLRRMDRGLLVTELMGQGINIVTGDYSRGAVGFWVEGGAISHPVHEVTVAGNLGDMFRDIVAVGSDVDRRGGIRSGSMLLAEMTIAGD
jgi:PmbA protein